MRKMALLTVLLFVGSRAYASTPSELLIGSWYFKRGIGHPCDSLIATLEYHFHKDGSYSTAAKMKSGEEYTYTGTYVATDSSTTATVEGRRIGPYPYTIRDGVLRISQPENGCDVELERE